MNPICEFCHITFTQRKNLTRHFRKFHPEVKLNYKFNTICPICKKSFINIANLQLHINNEHVKLNFDEEIFYCYDDFEAWKNNFEKNSFTHFVKHGKENKMADGKIIIYYFCHRSGFSKPKGKNVQHTKAVGLRKINATCPAHMKVCIQQINEATEIKVDYQSKHVGHDLELNKLPLQRTDKKQIASLLNQGVSKNKILTDIYSSKSSNNRLSLINKKDLYNISRDFKVNDKIVFNQEDAAILDRKVKKLRSESDNPILLYKPIGEELPGYLIEQKDFLLAIMNEVQLKLLETHGNKYIMIDTIQRTNMYGFYLTIIFIQDENNEAFPVSILYSSKINVETFIPFFKEIKNKLPNLLTRVFMNNDIPACYTAWKIIFGEVECYLLSSWHLEKTWERKLNIKIKDSKLRYEVKNKLEEIVHEIDIENFKQLSEIYISKLLVNAETKEFGEYLKSNYMNRTTQWANCYRLLAGIDTDVKIEQWRIKLKHELAVSKIIKRFDRSLFMLLSAIAKKLIGCIITLEPSLLGLKKFEIRKRHFKATELFPTSITEVQSKKEWVYVKPPNSNRFLYTYNIEFIKTRCCKIRCDDCKICLHQFTCTCLDYCMRLVICKHIHLICKFKNLFNLPSLTDKEEENINVENSQN